MPPEKSTSKIETSHGVPEKSPVMGRQHVESVPTKMRPSKTLELYLLLMIGVPDAMRSVARLAKHPARGDLEKAM